MKKFLVLILVVFVTFNFIGCSSEKTYEKAYNAFQNDKYEEAYKSGKKYLKKNPNDKKMNEIVTTSALVMLNEYYSKYGEQELNKTPFISIGNLNNGTINREGKVYFGWKEMSFQLELTDFAGLDVDITMHCTPNNEDDKFSYTFYNADGVIIKIFNFSFDRSEIKKSELFDEVQIANTFIEDTKIAILLAINEKYRENPEMILGLSDSINLIKDVFEKIEKDTSITPKDLGFVNW